MYQPGQRAGNYPEILSTLDVDRHGLYQLGDTFGRATFVVTSEEPVNDETGPPLLGRGVKDSLTLFEAFLGHDPHRFPEGRAFPCRGHPRPARGPPVGIKRAAAVVVELGNSTRRARQQIERDDAAGRVALQLWAGLKEEERAVLRTLKDGIEQARERLLSERRAGAAGRETLPAGQVGGAGPSG